MRLSSRGYGAAMRSQEERDEQTLRITITVLCVACVAGAVLLVAWLMQQLLQK